MAYGMLNILMSWKLLNLSSLKVLFPQSLLVINKNCKTGGELVDW